MKKFWAIRNEAEDAAAELLLYGEISDTTWWGDEVTPKAFAEDLKALQGKDLTVRVNSPGGDVFAAQAIYNQLKLYSGRVTMRIDGLAASAATIITSAGDTVIMPDNALFMIHNPKSALIGYYDEKELAKYAEQLGVVRQSIVNVYAKRVGDRLTDTQIKHKMDAETWMTADEAKALGFIDEIDSSARVENCLRDGMLVMNSVSCSLSQFKHGDTAAQLIQGFSPHSGVKSNINQGDREESEGHTMNDKNELLGKLKDLLGLSGAEETPTTAEEPVEADAALAERERIMALDALDDHTSPVVTKLVNAAKENGSTVDQVQPFIDAVKEDSAEKAEQRDMLEAVRALIRDEMASGAAAVAPSTPENKVDEKQAAIDEVVALANK